MQLTLYTVAHECYIIYLLHAKPGKPMPFGISIIIDGVSVPAELNDSETAIAIFDQLPIEAEFSTWGDEIYFPVPVRQGLQNGREVVELGELGYWPPGNAFCIFYGATPGSTEQEIRPASPVNSVGKVSDDPKMFRKLSGRSNRIRIEKA